MGANIMSLRDRITCVKELGELGGANELKKIEKNDLSGLYHNEERSACDDYLYMLYEREYQKGARFRRQQDGNKVIPVQTSFVTNENYGNYELAFEMGRNARNKSAVMLWITDKDLNALLEKVTDEGVREMCLCSWMAGFQFESEVFEPVSVETVPVLSYDRMMDMKSAFDNDDEPEPDTPAGKAYEAYCDCVKHLQEADLYDYIGCLSCPGMFRLWGQRAEKYKSESFEDCELNCADACRKIEEECGGSIGALEEYYVVEVPVNEALR